MNFNLYLDDQTAKELDRTASELGETRSGLIRKALWVEPAAGTTSSNDLSEMSQYMGNGDNSPNGQTPPIG